MDVEKIKTESDRYLDENLTDLWEIAQQVHCNPELAYHEYMACQLQCDYLAKKGFEVKRNIAGLDTAFVAKYGNGKPTIAILSEYDALPELGHGCGHNLICTSALGAGIIAKKFLEENPQNGTLLVIGTPAEESGGGKIQMLKEKVFDDVDAVIMQHPTSDLTRLAGECMSSMRMHFEFIGKAAHAGSHPDEGINALSSANLFVVASNMWRQQFKGVVHLSTIIDQGGVSTGQIPAYASVLCSLSAFNLKELKNNLDRLVKCAKCCAEAMGCEFKYEITEGYQGRVPNAVLSNSCRKELEKLNEPLLDGMPYDFGGEDVGNVSRIIPVCMPYVTIHPEYKISNHTPKFRELANSDKGLHCLEIASKAMGRTVIEWFVNPSIIDQAKQELKERLEKE